MVVLGERPSSSKRCTVQNLPPYPDVYTTRHITCVSCKEKFAVTEGNQGRRADFRDGNSSWRVHENTPTAVNLHYERERAQRPVVPLPRQSPRVAPPPIEHARPYSFQPASVNCPRCGADNRNWLALKQQAGDHSLGAFWRQWQMRFPSAFTAVFIAFLLAFLAYSMPSFMEVTQFQANILAVSTLVVTVLLINSITAQWDAYREDLHLAKILPKSRRLEPTLWGRNIAFLLLASVVLPILFFSAGPVAIQKIVEFISTRPEEAVVVTAEGINTEFDEQVSQSVNQVNVFGDELRDALNGLPTENQAQLEQEIEELSEDIADTAVTAAENVSVFGAQSLERLENNVDAQIAALESTRKTEAVRFKDKIMGSVRYLAVWGVIMGLSLVFTMMIMMPAMKAFATRVDGNLPPPVFYSVANMTRLVTWEARQALEVGNQHFDIQWMSVNRNKEGGLDLVGLFRDPPAFDAFGQATGTQVRAQKHIIHTDKWGRVAEAKIEDVLVPVPAGAPAGVMQMPQEASHDAPAYVRVRPLER